MSPCSGLAKLWCGQLELLGCSSLLCPQQPSQSIAPVDNIQHIVKGLSCGGGEEHHLTPTTEPAKGTAYFTILLRLSQVASHLSSSRECQLELARGFNGLTPGNNGANTANPNLLFVTSANVTGLCDRTAGLMGNDNVIAAIHAASKATAVAMPCPDQILADMLLNTAKCCIIAARSVGGKFKGGHLPPAVAGEGTNWALSISLERRSTLRHHSSSSAAKASIQSRALVKVAEQLGACVQVEMSEGIVG